MTVGYITPQDLVDAISLSMYMAIFDEGVSGVQATVDASSGVVSTLRRAHSQVASYLPRIYTTLPPEAPAGIPTGGDNISILLKDAEVHIASAYAYRRHPEYVKTYQAAPGGKMLVEFKEMMERIATLVQQIPATDTPPQATPTLARVIVRDNSQRMIIDNPDGTRNSGDF